MATSDQLVRIEYGVCTASDAEAMVRLLGVAFTRHDPPAVAVGLTASEFEAFVRLFFPGAAIEGLTVVAREAVTGEMVGVLLTDDCASAPPDGMDGLSPKFAPIFDILGQLDEAYRGGVAVRPRESLHLALLAVAASAGGRGVAQKLVSTCLENGAVRGYLTAVTEATNKASQHVFRKAGFSERVRGSYGSYRSEGKAVFASIADQGGPILMDKSLVS